MKPGIEKHIRKSFSKQSLMTGFDARLDQVTHGAVIISAPILASVLQQHGFAHAGLPFALGDSAAGYSALSMMPLGSEVLTSEMKIHLLAPGKGERLVARGRVIKPGRRLVIAAADVFALEGNEEVHVATLMGTMVPVLPS